MQRLLLFILLFEIAHSLNSNESVSVISTNQTQDENDLKYSIINNNQIEQLTSNQSILLIEQDNNETRINNNSNNNNEITTTNIVETNKNSIINRIMHIMDGYTLILIAAFLFGLIVVAILIFCGICICKRGSSKPSEPLTKITNPIYDVELKSMSSHRPDSPFQEDHIPMIDDINDSGETQKLLSNNEHNRLNTSSMNNKIDSSLVNTTTSGSCSTLSAKSVIETKTTTNDTTLEFKQTILDETKRVESTPDQEMSTLKNESLTNESASTPIQTNRISETNGIKRLSKFTPNSVTKSQQQLFQEQKLADSKVAFNRRSIAQSTINNDTSTTESNRVSAASSRSSLHQPINFDQIKNEIDEIEFDKDKFSSRSNVTSSHSDLARAESDNRINDIYVKEMLLQNKKLNEKKKIKNDYSISSNSISSSIRSTSKSMKSINVAVNDIKLDPNGNNDDSISVNTMESEKSCY